jgi:hypothetical protein
VIQTDPAPSQPTIQPQDFPAIGQLEARCPSCDHPFSKKPARKTKCRHCGNFCYVRTRPLDRQRVLVTEAQIALVEEQWAVVNGTHAEFLLRQQVIDTEREALKRRFGREPSMHDVQWSLLNKDLIEHATHGN